MSKRLQMALVGVFCFLLGALLMHLPMVGAQENKAKNPEWTHSMEMRVRKGGEAEFNKDTKKIGIEVYRDPANGNLIYLTETGSIAVVPSK